ncbi:MAG: hypothetical protein IIB62_08655 [Proteobacteria bacterium]|nr:hypothetical protein [Pseudomonadota bacterium]
MTDPLGQEVFNPLDKTHLAESVKDHLLRRPVVQLPPSRFVGAGIYAIYYTGDIPAYQRISRIALSDEKAMPIYVVPCEETRTPLIWLAFSLI